MMSKTSTRNDPANEKLDPRWVVVPLAVVLGALAVALVWPIERAATPAAAPIEAAVLATPQPQQAAHEATTVDGTGARAPADENESQEDNHAPTF